MSRIKCSQLEINVTNMAENIHFLNDLIAIISFYNEFRLKTSRHHRERRMLATRLTEGVKTCINEFTVRPRLPVNIKYDVQAIFSYILGNVSIFFLYILVVGNVL